ncbi:hypothetical protein V2J09_001040 [Rumex salicifolius]
MVARTPPKQQRKLMVAPLNPTLLRETVKKVDQCMARLQELQYTVTGGNKVVAGVNLSPRSTRGYLKASLRCKQESVRYCSSSSFFQLSRSNSVQNCLAEHSFFNVARIKGGKRSPAGKLPFAATDWRRMSLPAMLLGETVGEILLASKFTTDIVQTVAKPSDPASFPSDDPRTPVTVRRKQRPSDPDNAAGGIESRRKREKQHNLRIIRSETSTPALQRARSRINFKVPSPKRAEVEIENRKITNNSDSNSIRYSANRVSPRHRPWAKKAVLFTNPLFNSSPTSQRQRFCKTKSPVIAKRKGETHQIGATNNTTPHKFVIKSPLPANTKFQVRIRSPVAVAKISPPRAAVGSSRRASPLKMMATETAAKLRRSLSPARLASRLMSPMKSRRNSAVHGGGGGGSGTVVSGLKERPSMDRMMGVRSSRRI